MTDQPKTVTVWLERHGFDMDKLDPTTLRAPTMYVCARIQNATRPAPGENVTETQAEELIARPGWVVNLK